MAKPKPPNKPPGTVADSEQKGELLIRDLWSWVMYCILYMGVVKKDAADYLQKTPEKSL